MKFKTPRLWIISGLAGLMLGFVAAFLLLAAYDSGLFYAPVKVQFVELRHYIREHRFDSEISWFIEPRGSNEYLVTQREIFRRRQFIFDKNVVESDFSIEARSRINLDGDKIFTWPKRNELRDAKPSQAKQE